MQLESINRIVPSAPVSGTSDSGRNLQNQLISKEQNLSQISNDASLDAREKAKRRLELQREIEELNRKLELMRIRQEEKEKSAKAKDTKSEIIKEQLSADTDNNKQTEFSQNDKTSKPLHDTKDIDVMKDVTTNILSSNLILQDELMQQSVNMKTNNTKRIIQSEIRQDALYGNDTAEQKEEMYDTITKNDFLIETVNNEQNNTTHNGHQRIKLSITD